MHDALGKRMKEQYEQRAQTHLPRRTNTIIRLDGKAFHTFCRGMERPFDQRMVNAMTGTTIALCREIQGCKLGYTQSDEISLLLTDYTDINTQAWFDGNVQKMVSISAATATAVFTEELRGVWDTSKRPVFDSRVFTIPDQVEVANYFLWRMQDAVRNSRQALAQCLYSHKELHGKNASELLDLCVAKGCNWNDLPTVKKQGTVVYKNGNEWEQMTFDPPRNFEGWIGLIECVSPKVGDGTL